MAQATAAQAAAQAVAAKPSTVHARKEIEMARLAWQRAQTAAELADTSFRRVDGLAREGLIATQKRDGADAIRKASRDQALAAKAQYDMARAGARPKTRTPPPPRPPGGRRGGRSAGRTGRDRAQEPGGWRSGQVLARVGELSPQGVAVVSVVDLSDQWVVLNVREDRLQRFAVGTEFDATLPALGEQTVRFKVYANSALPDFATWRATRRPGFDVRTFEVRTRP